MGLLKVSHGGLKRAGEERQVFEPNSVLCLSLFGPPCEIFLPFPRPVMLEKRKMYLKLGK
jgi:hypothetical protein